MQDNDIGFESSVNSDGTQTDIRFTPAGIGFESSVNSDGTQTYGRGCGKIYAV